MNLPLAVLSSLLFGARVLTHAQTIDGLSFPRGSVVSHAAGGAVAVRLPRGAIVRGLPLTGSVRVATSGLSGDAMLSHDAQVDGFPCAASHPATFFRNALTGCTLRTPARVDGVPCAGAFDRMDGVRCRLASAFSLEGVRFERDSIVSRGRTISTVTVGSFAPGIRIFGSSLASGTNVRFRGATIDIDATKRIDDCTLWYVRLDHGNVTGRGYKCSVALPRSVVQR